LDSSRRLPYAQGMDSPAESPSGSDRERLPSERRELPRAYVARSSRERLREAMVRLAAEKGYAATTIDEVAEMAGVSIDTFYEYFPDKDACFFEAFDAVNDVLVAHVSAAYEAAAGEPWPERIAAALRALVELLATEADIARATMVEVTAAGDDARKRYGEALARFTPLLDEGREYSRRPSLPEDTARFAIGGATSLIYDEVRAGRGQELPRILPQLVFAVLMPYLGPQAAEEEMRRVTAD
jgi:AcrR family transcriptional regulator